ncbi:PKD domain-containing protein [Pontibacter liquoris]|uniref:Ig-like domain-containing protein n=1 Tax=Pontibacter liquoris TaxID=2905677 RepID=UPI001FA6FC16|nr:gliding motility-associated C-terminal domain-containing protein [Pontibacter liquoris]
MRLFLPKHYTLFLLLLCFIVGRPLVALSQTCTVSIESNRGTTLCEGESIELTSRPGAGFTPTAWQWYRDNQPLAGATSATYTTNVGGVYRVEASGGACAKVPSGDFSVTVVPTPAKPIFSISNNNTCAGTALEFTVINPQPGVVYTWDFGDGSISNQNPVTHTYEAKGTGVASFDVSVFGVSPQGCSSDTLTQSVSVKKVPEIAFTEKNDFQVCLPDSVEPQDTAVFAELTNVTADNFKNDINTYYIDWGDGKEVPYPAKSTTFPLKAPNAFPDLGDYTIKVRGENTNQCSALFEQVYSYSKKPKANFTLDKKSSTTPGNCTPIIVSLGDSSTGGNLTYLWEIKDQNNIGGYSIVFGGLDQDTLQIEFTLPGVFQLQLVVSNGCGSDTTEQSIVVGYPQAQLPAPVIACGDTTIKYNAQNTFIDANLGKITKYEWFVDGALVSGEQFPELTFNRPGVYKVSLRVTNDCGTSDDIGPPQPQEITINPVPSKPIVQGQTTCAGDSVTLRPQAAGTYEWYDQPTGGTLLASGASFTTPLLNQTTTFYVQAKSDLGCSSERVPVIVTVTPAIDNNVISPVAQSICKGGTASQLTGTAPTGGPGTGYTYTWQASTTGPDAGFALANGTNNAAEYTPAALSQTTWFRRVVSSGTCTADTSDAVQVTVVPVIENNTINASQEICAQEQPAPLTGTPPTGGDGVTFAISWEVSTDGPTTGFVPAPGNNTGANYTPGVLTQDSWFRRVVASGGCQMASEPVKISVLPALANNTIAQDQNVCRGTAPQSLLGSAPTGGNGKYTYLWESSTSSATGGFTAAAGTNNGQSYNPGGLSRTTWFRRIITTGSCKADTSAAVQITVSEGVTNNSITASQTVCAGQTPATLTGSAPTGGTGTYTYLWQSSTISPDAGFVDAAGANTGTTYSPQALTQNTWFRRLVTSAGCADTSAAIAITVTPVPKAPSLTVRDAVACQDSSATLTVQDPGSSTTYEWYTAPAGGRPVFIGPVFQTPALSQPTTFYVQAVNTSGCSSATRTPVAVNVIRAEANAGPDVTIIQRRTTELRASGGATYHWEPATGLSSPDVANPVARPDVTTTYTVTVTTAEGCQATDEVTVTVIPAITIPNAFSPNHDGVNEVWEIENIHNFPEARVEIFNRWGNLLYTSNGYGTPWDGTYNGQELPVATYYYIIYLNSTEKPISGNVTIIR